MWESFKEKADNFFYHYKTHVILGSLLAIFIISLGYSVIKGQISNYNEKHKIGIDLEILVFGNYKHLIDLEPMQERIKEMLPGLNVELTYEYAPNTSQTPEDFGAQYSNLITMATSTPDIYIVDEYQFNKLVVNHLFSKLDEQIVEQVPEDNRIYYLDKTDDEPQVYGIDISNNPFFDDSNMEEYVKWIFIREDAVHLENANLFINLLLQ